jgi:predicted nucleic acid-binding protein
MIILDTNVLSEVMRSTPAAEVLRWVATQSASRLFTTTITQAEILSGIELLPKGKRRAGLQSAVQAMFEEDFAGRILPFDSDAARLFAHIAALRRMSGRPIIQWDAQIAAIARSRGAALATRNTGDFEGCGVTLFNPWNT